jgi:hypothetical protein
MNPGRAMGGNHVTLFDLIGMSNPNAFGARKWFCIPGNPNPQKDKEKN